MTKRFCDVCGKEMTGRLTTISDSIKFATFAISENGKFWDICDGCRVELSEWIRNKKEKNNATQS